MNTTVIEELESSLRGPRRARADMLSEIRDGLDDAAEAYLAAGLTAEAARRQAEADFGDPAPVAAELQVEVAARYGVRSALVMALIMPAMMLMWDLIWSGGPSGQWPPATPLVSALSRLIDTAAIATACVCALVLLVLASGLRVPVSLALRTLGLIVVCGVSLTVAASLGMHLVGAAHAFRMMPQVLAASIVSAVLASWLTLRACRCLQLAAVR